MKVGGSSWTCLLGIWAHLPNAKNKSVFFLSVHFLLLVSWIFCLLTLSLISYFSTLCKHTRWVCSPFDCCFAITLSNIALHLLYLDRFIKTNSFPCQFSWWSLFFFKIRLTSAEIRISCLTSEQIALAAVFYFGQSFFYFGMVSTNNITYYSEQIYKPF